MAPLKSVSFICIWLYTCFTLCSSQKTNKIDVIGFPESEENPDLKNKENRTPVFIPAMCPENELYYPGDQKDDWICDCRPSFIYHPGSDACWPAYQKGPCAQGEYLVLSQGAVIPVCAKNPCVADGYVPWNNGCQRLGTTSPCDYLAPVPAVLGVNATSLAVSCLGVSIANRFTEDTDLSKVCTLAGKRNINGKCVPT